MNTNQNLNQPRMKSGSIPGKPSSSACLLFALVSVAAAVILPEMGFFSAVALSVTVIFMASARAFFPIMLIPFLGSAGLFVRAGYVYAAISAALIISSMIAGFALNRGGFHKALMLFSFTAFALATGGAAFLMWHYKVSVAEIYDAYKYYMSEALDTFVKTAGTKLTAEEAKLLVTQYEEMGHTLFLYAPVAIAWMIEVCGIIALRLTGIFHNVTGSIMYPYRRRVHLVNKIFAVVYFAAMLVGFAGVDVVGVCAANVMLILAVPAASAGISELRRSIILRRASGKRGFPFTLFLVVIVSLGISVGAGLIILGVIGCLPAFRKDLSAKSGK